MALYLGDTEVAPVIEVPVPETKYGATVGMVLGDEPVGDLSFDGVKTVGFYQFYGRFARSFNTFADRDVTVSFPDTTSVGIYGLANMFACQLSYARDNLRLSILFPKLESVETSGMEGFMAGSVNGNAIKVVRLEMPLLSTVGASGLKCAFVGATNNYYNSLETVDLPSLTSVANYGLQECFSWQGALKTVSLTKLASITGRQAFRECFKRCSSLETVLLPSLQSITGNSSMQTCFMDCIALKTISFPALTTVASDAFGAYASGYIFNGCTALTEIHFRADAQAAIEAMTGYADKWGAPDSCSILFDL